MTRPTKVNLHCDYCGHTWLEPTTTFDAQNVVIYRDGRDTVKRLVPCPNCDKDVIVSVPADWVNNE
jgi:ribosomal protein S27E